MNEQMAFSFETQTGYRFVVQDIQLKMRGFQKTLFYQPIRISFESAAFGDPSLSDLADKVVEWVKRDSGIISLTYDQRLRVLTGTVDITAKVIDPKDQLISMRDLERFFITPFARTPQVSQVLLEEDRAKRNLLMQSLMSRAR